MSLLHPFSIDLEDWYQGIESPFSAWAGKEERLHQGMDKLIALLDASQTKCTFFVLGWIGEKHPQLIRRLADAGHEIASHGYSHEKVYDLSPQKFREESMLTKTILEDCSGQQVVGHRAPFFSITEKSLWALEILKECGYTYDCSISPVKTWRYGIAGCPEEIFRIKEIDLLEFPVSTFSLLHKKLGIGGAYFRIFPYWFFKKAFQRNTAANRPTMFYAHPWEYDPAHPRVEMEFKAKLTHYHNLKGMYARTEKLLHEFSFGTVASVLAQAEAAKKISTYSLHELSSTQA